jgi:Asp/Glu/hydantoin racemase
MTIKQYTRVLVFNPNTSESVTESFKPFLSGLNLSNMDLTYWTCPTGPSLIKTQAHMFESASHCLPLLLAIVDEYDGFLGACYADHPIVRLLQSYVHDKPVVGIFDASVLAASHLTTSSSKFAIITTGLPFEELLTEGVKQLLGGTTPNGKSQLCCFGGVAATGIGADDLTIEAQQQAREKIIAATRRILCTGEIGVLCVGGVILAGMEPWIREACEEELGSVIGGQVKIVEQLTVGALVLDAMLYNRPRCDFTPALR